MAFGSVDVRVACDKLLQLKFEIHIHMHARAQQQLRFDILKEINTDLWVFEAPNPASNIRMQHSMNFYNDLKEKW